MFDLFSFFLNEMEDFHKCFPRRYDFDRMMNKCSSTMNNCVHSSGSRKKYVILKNLPSLLNLLDTTL